MKTKINVFIVNVTHKVVSFIMLFAFREEDGEEEDGEEENSESDGDGDGGNE